LKNEFFLNRHLVYFSSYISTISTLAKFFNSSLKLVDSKQRLFNSNNAFDESLSSSPSYSNGMTPLRNL
jgi:ADP-glucose pyrophosphorylase